MDNQKKSSNKIIESFIEIGFLEKEAYVYMSILKSGKSFISDITKDLGFKRSSIINYIENLLSKGTISKVVIGKRIAYITEKPELILKDFVKKKEKFEKNIPELNNLFLNSGKKAKVRYFEGKKGIIQIYSEISSQFKTIYTFVSLEKILTSIGLENLNNFRKVRIKNETKVKDLIKNTEFARKFMKERTSYFGTENKWLPKEFDIKIDLLIWGDSIAMISFEKEMGVVIENEDMADFQRNLHNYVWNSIK